MMLNIKREFVYYDHNGNSYILEPCYINSTFIYKKIYKNIFMKTDIEKVKELGEEIGYGHLMCLASALWRKSLKDQKIPVTGAFIPTLYDFIVKDKEIREITDNDITKYDSIVNPVIIKAEADNSAIIFGSLYNNLFR